MAVVSVFTNMTFLLLSLISLLSAVTLAKEENCTNPVSSPRSFQIIYSGCNTTLPQKQKEEIQAFTTVLLVPLLYLISFVFGLPANLTALWVLLFRSRKHPSTILFINLTCCDLFLLLLLPLRIIYHFQGNDWWFGETLCCLLIALFYGTMYGSVTCLALIALDRYVAIVHPFGAKTLRSQKSSLIMSVVVWLVVVVAGVPMLIKQQTYRIHDLSITTCHDALPQNEQQLYFRPYFAALFFCCFVFPLFLVLFCYGSVLRTLVAAGARYDHASRVTVLVLVVFIICFLPSNILLLLHYFNLPLYSHKLTEDDYMNPIDGGSDYDVYDSLYMPYMISLAVSTFSSCLDPFIFYYVSEDFREKARQLLSCSRTYDDITSRNSSGTTKLKVTLLSVSNRTVDFQEKDTVNT